VTYFKPRGQPWLAAKNIVHEDDPRIAMTSAEFLAKAWKVANDKERAGVDCVRVPLGRPPPPFTAMGSGQKCGPRYTRRGKAG
jgi:hypothetical protein